MGVPKSSDGETIPGARTTTTAGSDGSSRAAGPGPPGLDRTPRREMSEGGDPPTPPSGEPTIDLPDPAATTGRGGSPAATGPPAPRGVQLDPEAVGTLTVARPGEPPGRPAGGEVGRRTAAGSPGAALRDDRRLRDPGRTRARRHGRGLPRPAGPPEPTPAPSR